MNNAQHTETVFTLLWDDHQSILSLEKKINTSLSLYSAGSGKERRILEEAASGLAEKESIDFSPWLKGCF